MFRHANPARKIPTYLQAYTVENLVWQLKLTAVLLAGVVVYSEIEQRREKRRLHSA